MRFSSSLKGYFCRLWKFFLKLFSDVGKNFLSGWEFFRSSVIFFSSSFKLQKFFWAFGIVLMSKNFFSKLWEYFYGLKVFFWETYSKLTTSSEDLRNCTFPSFEIFIFKNFRTRAFDSSNLSSRTEYPENRFSIRISKHTRILRYPIFIEIRFLVQALKFFLGL